MESLESRIARLTPEQQREVEDFVDFLLLKNNIRQAPVSAMPSPALMAVPPVMIPEPVPAIPLNSVPAPSMPFISESPLIVINAESSPAPIREIMVGGDDGITRDYLDYGEFDHDRSPANRPAKKGRHGVIVRQTVEKSPHVLDWFD
ncbi:MAG: hypothetical protein M0Q92_10745 [Methanoregula sp.]|jgi:hypothetical protein|nr:hypothetical protein [Methanoregula sp.]